MADDPYPAALEQRLDDVRVHRHAANLLDLSARDRLTIRHQREGLEQGARVFGRALLPEARDGLRDGRTDLDAIAARDFHELDAASLVIGLQGGDRAADLLGVRSVALVEQRDQLVGRQAGGRRRAARPRSRCVHIGRSLASRKVVVGGGMRWRHRRRPPASNVEPDCRDARARVHRLRIERSRSIPRATARGSATKVTVTPRRPSSARNRRTKSRNELAFNADSTSLIRWRTDNGSRCT